MSMLRWWGVVVGAGAAALLFAWAGRLAGVPASTLLAVGGGVAALMWTVVLVTLPWNLYFEARQVLRRNAASRARGVQVPDGNDDEARVIARRTLWLALGGHVGSAVATAVFALATGSVLGYWLAAFFLISTAVRPAVSFLKHLRERLFVLRRESTYPPDDVATMKGKIVAMKADLDGLRERFELADRATADELRRIGAGSAGGLARLESAQAADRAEYRDLSDRTGRRIDLVGRRIEATLDGISDHQELLIGIRALIRLMRAEQA
jgi:hypothetical protein